MALNFNGINQSEIDISGQVDVNPCVPTPNANQTVINIQGTGNGSVQNVYTVPSDKTFYLYGFVVDTSVASLMQIYKNDGTTRVGLTSGLVGQPPVHICSFTPVWAYVANDVVKINVTNAVTYRIWGILI